LNDREIEKFWAVIEHPDVSALILQKAAFARQTTLAYLDQEGLCDSSRWAIVDVGWTLKTQRALKKILEQGGGYTGVVRGYYLGLSTERCSISESGPFRAFVLLTDQQDQAKSLGQCLLHNVGLVEQVFTMADHGSVTQYEKDETGKFVPVLKKLLKNAPQQDFVAKFHHIILCYSEQLAQTDLLVEHINDLKENALMIVEKFLSNPRRSEAEAIAWIFIGDDQNEAQHHKLARKLNLGDLFYYFARLGHPVASRDFVTTYSWFEGSFALSSLWIRILFLPLKLVRELKHRGVLPSKYYLYRIMAKRIL
jgi:hypothetical protein